MKSETQLHSAVFQLTPTRTRCDLVVISNERTEKIATGLVTPFLAHLNAAQEQMAKGGYSIILEPDPGSNATWFTKATVERFVRFVSTPEVLERVNAIESEILQMEEAISVLSNENSGMNIQVENHQSKPTEIVEGKFPFNSETDRAIVLYKPGEHQQESNGFNIRGDTSKVQLLKVLEMRQTALQKEQGMAFARAVAAGFDMDHMTHLISFAECFGATRMMEACLKFMEFWKRKHETGQWTEIEAVSVPKEFSSFNVSGIMLSSEMRKQKEVEEYLSGTFAESNGKSISSGNADEGAQHEYPQIQFQHPIYPQWPIHSPQGAPFFPNYPMPGMPYYQNFPGNSAFYHPSHPPVEESRFNSDNKRHMKRHSMTSKDSNVESEILEASGSSTKSHDDADQNISEYEKESSNQVQTKRGGHSRKKQPGVVVIRNINYITSKQHQTSGSESQLSSDQEIDMEPDTLLSDSRDTKEKNSMKFSKANKTLAKSVDNVDITHGENADNGNWQAFQKCLLQCKEERTTVASKDIFSVETNATVKRKPKTTGSDPILPSDRYSAAASADSMKGYVIDAGKVTRVYGKTTLNNDLGTSRDRFLSGNESRQRGIDATEMQGPQRRYRIADSESILVHEQESSSNFQNSFSGSLLENELKNSSNLGKNSLHPLKDDSFIVPSRTNLQDQIRSGNRTYVGNDYEFPSALQRSRVVSNRSRNHPSYEPDDLIPDRQTERESTMHDPTVDCELLVHSNDLRVLVRQKKGISSVAVNKGSDKLGKEKKGNGKDGIGRKKMDTTMKNVKLPSKFNPSAEAQKRAERLRAFKTDLQKAKKEQQEEKIKYLQALKTERQKRIAARSVTNSSQSRLQVHSKRNQASHNLTSSLQKENRISQLKEAPAMPPRKVTTRNSFMGSNKIGSTNKPSRLTTTNAVGKSMSKSLFDLKKENFHILNSESHESHTSTKVEGILAKLSVPGESEVKKIKNHLANAHVTPTREARIRAKRVPGNTS